MFVRHNESTLCIFMLYSCWLTSVLTRNESLKSGEDATCLAGRDFLRDLILCDPQVVSVTSRNGLQPTVLAMASNLLLQL